MDAGRRPPLEFRFKEAENPVSKPAWMPTSNPASNSTSDPAPEPVGALSPIPVISQATPIPRKMKVLASGRAKDP
jgi:hypothetical protein